MAHCKRPERRRRQKTIVESDVIDSSLQEAGDVRRQKTIVDSDVIYGSLQEAGDVKAMVKATVESEKRVIFDGSPQEAIEVKVTEDNS